MNPLDDLNSLNYTSSAADIDLAPVDEPKYQDKDDLSALEQVYKLLENRKAYYLSIEAIDLNDKSEALRTQLKDNKRMLFHINELEQLITTTIRKVKETFNNGQ